VGQQQIITQPLIIALEKEFINRAEYERRHSDIENRVKEVSKYAHDEVHAIRSTLQAMQSAGELRDQMLHKLDERTITHTRQLSAVDAKVDRVVDRVADKVEGLLKREKQT
jgi:membrane-bound ClpP family serine protease